MEPPEARPRCLLGFLGLAFTLSLVALAGPADSLSQPAPTTGTRSMELPAHLVGGTFLQIAIPLPAGSFDEAEVYLSLDDGRTFPVRLSEEIRPHHRLDVLVTLPDLFSRSARICVRAGGQGSDGRREEEIARSSRFELSPGHGLPFSRLEPDAGARPRQGDFARVEWWFTGTRPSSLDLPGADWGSCPEFVRQDECSLAFEADPSWRADGRPSRESSPLPPDASRGGDAPEGPRFLLRLQLAASPRPLRV